VFYASFALVVTSSVRIAGVLLVFSLFVQGLLARLIVGWALGALLTLAGLLASWYGDLPTGPAVVSAFGAAAGVVALASVARRLGWRGAGIIGCVVAALAGLLLLAFPRMDQPWLDALEALTPPVQTAFLEPGERYTRSEALQSMESARAELARLRALDEDARWGSVSLPPEERERLRQYLAGRSEISAGDQLVLRHLRAKARERQRYALGIPLLVLGALGFWSLRDAKRCVKSSATRV